jgi:hypothetical protein
MWSALIIHMVGPGLRHPDLRACADGLPARPATRLSPGPATRQVPGRSASTRLPPMPDTRHARSGLPLRGGSLHQLQDRPGPLSATPCSAGPSPTTSTATAAMPGARRRPLPALHQPLRPLFCRLPMLAVYGAAPAHVTVDGEVGRTPQQY